MTDIPSAPPARKAAVAFIFVTIVIDMVTFGIVMPVLPRLIEDFLQGDTTRAAQVFGILTAVWAFMQFFASPIQGALSDRFGRRPVILASNFGLATQFVVLALAPNLAWVFVGRALSGITSASIATASAYIADVTPPHLRAQRFGLVGMAFGLGFVLGPALGGVLGEYDPRLPFWVAAACCLINATYGIFVLPESLSKENRSPFSWRRANPVGSLDLLRAHPTLLGLASVHFLFIFAQSAFPSVMVLYLGYRYGWGPSSVGFTFAMIGLLSAISQGVLIRPAVKRLGERKVMLLGLGAGCASFALTGSAPTGLFFLLALPISAIWQWASPANQALMTVYISPQEQGRLQGALSSLSGVSAFVGPLAFTGLFAHFIAPERGWVLPGAPFYLASLLMMGAFALAWHFAQRPPSGKNLVEEIAHGEP